MQQSHKRFHNANRWQERWYRILHPSHKLFWEYINDNCDNIGVWIIDLDFACYQIGIDSIDLKSFLQNINEDEKRVLQKVDRILLYSFVPDQYCPRKPLDPFNNNAHRSYTQLMIEHDLFDWFCQNHSRVMTKAVEWKESEQTPKRPLKGDSQRHKEKEQEEEEEQETEQEKPPSSNFDKAEKLFNDYRRLIRYEHEYPDHIEEGIFQKILEKGISYDTLVSDIEEYASELDGKHGEPPEIFYENYVEVNHE
ncbi:hypothetical protein [Rhodohalobacter sp. 614A]|uniref:hypothetical protein n=1 Tax=Rhodohalobacter sp. 614A TaxID=2908649 RepID=UPI001F22A6EF|nr:hypothetical protein [Rhodohalobacter sp. 614A]